MFAQSGNNILNKSDANTILNEIKFQPQEMKKGRRLLVKKENKKNFPYLIIKFNKLFFLL